MIEILVDGLKFAGIVLIILLALSGFIFIAFIWVKYFISPMLDWIDSWGTK